ncbi:MULTISPECIES: hypothetical protein [Paenibacillus]|uniref:hypothetical protein n=1 Tax=Paenibacillus TaxID=44249 RepID=UPI0022B8593B|nr:hypothetical protein [Paenibacillus caseinilyticus]MCZ8523507.1 hypothetical protein [Paenibacillus caseinilyticus]
MSKLPLFMRSVNESLDELMVAIEKVNTICQSAEHMSPAVRQLAKLVAEAKAAAGKPVGLHEAKRTPGKRRRRRGRRNAGRD